MSALVRCNTSRAWSLLSEFALEAARWCTLCQPCESVREADARVEEPLRDKAGGKPAREVQRRKAQIVVVLRELVECQAGGASSCCTLSRIWSTSA